MNAGGLNFAPAKSVVPRARGYIIWWCCEFLSHGGNRFPSHRVSCNSAQIQTTWRSRRIGGIVGRSTPPTDLQQDRLL
jgi:hypothetical protein